MGMGHEELLVAATMRFITVFKSPWHSRLSAAEITTGPGNICFSCSVLCFFLAVLFCDVYF